MCNLFVLEEKKNIFDKMIGVSNFEILWTLPITRCRVQLIFSSVSFNVCVYVSYVLKLHVSF